MIIRLIITLCCVSFLSDGVFAEGENEIKRNRFPYMAFLYYPDESVVDASGARFLRGAVLVKPEWLVSSTVGPMVTNDGVQGFPRKTLMARLGAVAIDANFTLNEDEDEQEREVVQIVRPYNHSVAQWWRNDISLLKTLLPFNMTAAVATATIHSKSRISNANCYILVFARRFDNVTDDRMLMKIFVELQPPSIGCGQHFYEDTMLCANDDDENKNSPYDPEYCQGNSGGPLVCDNEVAGLQTYVKNNCKQPHLYQLLSAWDNFITCGIEDKCGEENCAHMCMLINKDEPVTEELTTSARKYMPTNPTTVTEEITIPVQISTEITTDEDEITVPAPTLTTATELLITVDTTLTTSTTLKTTKTAMTTTTTTTTTTETTAPSAIEETEEISWPKEKYPGRMKHFEEEENKIERKTSVEAQLQDVKVKRARGAAEKICMIQSLFTLCVLVSLM